MVGVGSTTLAQRSPFVNILSLAVGSISSWNEYAGPTLGHCIPETCLNMTELRWAHCVGPTLDQSTRATLFLGESLLEILRWFNVWPLYTENSF